MPDELVQQIDRPRRANPWSRRLFAGAVIVGSLALGWRYGDDYLRLLIALGSANGALVLHMIGHSMDVRALADFASKLGAAIKEARHG